MGYSDSIFLEQLSLLPVVANAIGNNLENSLNETQKAKKRSGEPCGLDLAVALLLWGIAILVTAPQGRAASAAAEETPFSFRDVSEEAGLRTYWRGMMGHAAGWGDVNGDGWLDLFVGTYCDRSYSHYQMGGVIGPVPNLLFINERGKFRLSGEKAIQWYGRCSGVIMADLDNDGRVDLYVSNNGYKNQENRLFHNQGRGKFEDVTDKAGAPVHLPGFSRCAGVLDYDGDDLLDILVLGTIGKAQTVLFHNLGNMKFKLSYAIPTDAVGLGLAVGDLTGNGWPDVMIGGPNRLFVNQGDGRFREATELDLNWGFKSENDAPSCGVAFGDFDLDGKADILFGSNHSWFWLKKISIRLFRNLGSTPLKVRFEEVTERVGIRKFSLSASHVEIRDFDNDGWPDLLSGFVTYRDGKIYPGIYKNLGASKGELPRFQETAMVYRSDFPGPDDGVGKDWRVFYRKYLENKKVMIFAGTTSSDFNNDGRLDLVMPTWYPTGTSHLLANETRSGHYLKVEVAGAQGVNRMGIGAVAQAFRAGNAEEPSALLASEEIATSYGYCSAQAPIAHLGLGTATVCDVMVVLPHGKGRIIKRNVKANQHLQIAH